MEQTRPHRARRAAAALAALVALALPATAAAAAQEPGVTPGPVVELPGHQDGPAVAVPLRGTAESAATDAAIIAADRGWKVPATLARMDQQDRFGDLVDAVTEQYGARFSGAEFAARPGATSHLRFKGTVPAGARSLAAASGLPVELTGGRKHSAVELEQRTVAVVQALRNAGFAQISAAVLAEGTIDVAAKGTAPAGFQLPAALREGVRVTFVAHDVAVDHDAFGGAYIHSNGSQCTSGFSVRHEVTNLTGLATAAHCSGMNHYHQPRSSTRHDIFWQDQHIGSNGDMEWHTTTGADLAEYDADTNDHRIVHTVETSAAVNNTYCVYSRMQGDRLCDDVYSTYVVQVTTSGVAMNLVAMDGASSVGGDSGGPWSYSTEAAGVVKGAMWLPFKMRDTWTKAWLFDNSLDVDVMTQ